MSPIGDDNSARRSLPVVTGALLALNVAFFFLELSGGDQFILRWAFVPRRFLANPGGGFVTVFTSMFMHGGWVHLGGTMLYLWILGPGHPKCAQKLDAEHEAPAAPCAAVRWNWPE